VAQRVLGALGYQISWHSAREGGEVVSLTDRPPLAPGIFLLLIFWVYPRVMVRSEGDISLKNPVTPPGIDPGTARLVVQRLNHYAIRNLWKTYTDNIHSNLLKTVQDTIQTTSVMLLYILYVQQQKSWWRNWIGVVVIDSSRAWCSAVQCSHYTQEGHCYGSCYGFL
jgi:hypothetical protein